MISIVASVARNNVIGNKNQIPWHLPLDLVHLKNLTLNQVVIVGMKTYLSMEGYYDKSGREMPGKIYLVLTDDKKFKPKRKNAKAVHSIEESIKVAGKYKSEEVFAIGGNQVFKQFMPIAKRMYLTEVDVAPKGDTYFPEFSKKEWKIISSEAHPEDERHQYSFKFITYEKK